LNWTYTQYLQPKRFIYIANDQEGFQQLLDGVKGRGCLSPQCNIDIRNKKIGLAHFELFPWQTNVNIIIIIIKNLLICLSTLVLQPY
jgi:hypothetical protein